MKTTFPKLIVLFFSIGLYAQTGHIMQGVGAVNMSMGGAATAQPLDISGAMHWNPASVAAFDHKVIKFDVGLFFSSPSLSSSLPSGMLFQAGDMGPGSPESPPVFGTTEDERGLSLMPAIAMLWAKEDSKHTFGLSAFGISGFGVTFPQETNLPFSADGNPNMNWDPSNSNPILWPQAFRGFGRVQSDYMLLQVSGTWAYELSDKVSIGIQPNINYAALTLEPNPLAAPDFPQLPNEIGKGYPVSDKASAIGFGAQFGIFYDSKAGIKLGASYKTAQKFNAFEFKNTYLDGSSAPEVAFQMDYPAIVSMGIGYSINNIDLALDFRRVLYEDTEGFKASGWQMGDNGFPTGAVQGFGWNNISVLSVGAQYKGIHKLPLRFGYTHSSNPIAEELAFFSTPAPAIIRNAYQLGLSYELTNKWQIDAVYHYGTSDGKTQGTLLDPSAISPTNPLGKIPGTTVAYDMTTSMIMFGIQYQFLK
ncbi:outer membrane protein transport protein [Tenacibaculum tangerinum]|uniref:Outer membrane protein transport protein n=1 Tax=Tenacibaculum tangerinum TaxID=3038772 RepID=A0ABY8L7P8_9FLAO|nr:outer membrane protein transport protein [Tenacibaculum tangerinum]WGH76213.1 outer membrane protein transport protein [Tenacibaculum tangerinum]